MSLTTLNGALTNSDTSPTVAATLTEIPASKQILIDDEVILVTGFGGSGNHDYTGCTRGAKGSVAVAHNTATPVYELKHVHQNSNGLVFYYIADDGSMQIRTWTDPSFQQDLDFTPVTAVTPLTDSTTGTPAATLVALRTDTVANLGADAKNNIASLNAQLNLVAAKLIALQDAITAGTVDLPGAPD